MTAIGGLALSGVGLALLLLLLASGWGGGFSGPISLLLCLAGLGIGVLGTVWIIIGSAAILEPRRRRSPPT